MSMTIKGLYYWKNPIDTITFENTSLQILFSFFDPTSFEGFVNGSELIFNKTDNESSIIGVLGLKEQVLVSSYVENNNNYCPLFIDFGETETTISDENISNYLENNLISLTNTALKEEINKYYNKLSGRWKWKDVLDIAADDTFNISTDDSYLSIGNIFPKQVYLKDNALYYEDTNGIENLIYSIEDGYTAEENSLQFWNFGYFFSFVKKAHYDFLCKNAVRVDEVTVSHTNITTSLDSGRTMKLKCKDLKMPTNINVTTQEDSFYSQIIPVNELPNIESPSSIRKFSENNYYLYNNKYYKGTIKVEDVFIGNTSLLKEFSMIYPMFLHITSERPKVNLSSFSLEDDSIVIKNTYWTQNNPNKLQFCTINENNEWIWQEEQLAPFGGIIYFDNQAINSNFFYIKLRLFWEEQALNEKEKILIVDSLPEQGIEGAYYATQTFNNIITKIDGSNFPSIFNDTDGEIFFIKTTIEKFITEDCEILGNGTYSDIYYLYFTDIQEIFFWNILYAAFFETGFVPLKIFYEKLLTESDSEIPFNLTDFYFRGITSSDRLEEHSGYAAYYDTKIYHYLNGSYIPCFILKEEYEFLEVAEEAEVSFSETSASENLIIPSTSPAGYPVISISGFNDTIYRNITLPNSLTSINSNAFENSIIGAINIPEGVTNINSSAFEYVNALKEITLPSTLETLGLNAFSGSSIEKLTFMDGFETFTNSQCFQSCHRLKEVILPKTLKAFANSTFQYCDKLKSITIPEGITNIPSQCFLDCHSLETINFPSTLTSITNWSAFGECTSLKHIDLSETNLNSLNGFCYCYNLHTVILPNTLKTIESSSFDRCRSLKEIFFDGTIEEWKAITIKSGWNRGTLAKEVVCSNGSIPLVAVVFNIDTLPYHANEEMTWNAWVSSSYNYGNFKVEGDLIRKGTSGGYVLDSEGNQVTTASIIEDGKTYTISS